MGGPFIDTHATRYPGRKDTEISSKTLDHKTSLMVKLMVKGTNGTFIDTSDSRYLGRKILKFLEKY